MDEIRPSWAKNTIKERPGCVLDICQTEGPSKVIRAEDGVAASDHYYARKPALKDQTISNEGEKLWKSKTS